MLFAFPSNRHLFARPLRQPPLLLDTACHHCATLGHRPPRKLPFARQHLYGKDLSLLLTGKVSIEYVQEIESLIQKGLAVPSKHITDSYAENKNTNKKVDFILKSLK